MAETEPKGEKLLVIAVLLLAAILRLWGLQERGLTHYDEGAYAMTAQAIAAGEGSQAWYPTQHWLSPPVFFLSASVPARFGLTPTDAVLGLAALWGVLGVFALWRLARDHAGPRPALVAALLLAACPTHLLYTRAGLTDGAFLALFLLALLFWSRVIRTLSWRDTLLAGLCTGLAWNTKYHGWLAMACAFGGFLPALVRRQENSGALLIRMVVASALAIALYVPWVLHIEGEPGGYVGLMEQHRSFLKPGALLDNLRVQFTAQEWLSANSSLLLALCAAAFAGVMLRARSLALPAFLGLALSGFSPWISLPLIAFAVLSEVPAWWKGDPRAGLRLAFLGGFAVLTPLYHPYPRLTLPMLAAAILALSSWERVRRERPVVPLAVALAFAALIAGPRQLAPQDLMTPWRGLDAAVEEVLDELPADVPCHVIGEPGVITALREEGRVALHFNSVQAALEAIPRGGRAAIVYGRYATLGEQLEALRASDAVAEHSAGARAQTGPARWLDDFRPRRLEQLRAAGAMDRHYPLRVILLRR